MDRFDGARVVIWFMIAVLVCMLGIMLYTQFDLMFTWEEARAEVIDVSGVEVKNYVGTVSVVTDKITVHYVYRVGDVEYTGASVTGYSISTGAKINIKYNPKNPAKSTVWSYND